MLSKCNNNKKYELAINEAYAEKNTIITGRLAITRRTRLIPKLNVLKQTTYTRAYSRTNTKD